MNRIIKTGIFCVSIILLASCDDGTTTANACGDGFVDPGEDCDGAVLSATCQSLGYYNVSGTLTCSSECRFDTTDCGQWCGDDVITGAEGEECDGTNLNGQTCLSQGSGAGILGCTSDCQFDLSGCSAVCGNGVIEAGEVCDDGDADPDDGCSAACAVEAGWTCSEANPSLCSPICGDNLLVGPEECDPATIAEENCELHGFHPGPIACTEVCMLDFSGCDGQCGDGVIQEAWESCDSGDFAGQTCSALGYLFGGALTCGTCQIDETSCLSVVAIAPAHGYHTCAVLSDGTARCWGMNDFGQLGDDTFVDRSTPVAVVGLTNAVAISGGLSHTCALLSDRTVRCWGANESGQLGNGNTTSTKLPVQVSSITDAVAISAGNQFNCALLNTGGIQCWGNNGSGQLGNGNTTGSLVPVNVFGGTTYQKVSAGFNHVCALLTTGNVACWGANNAGQLGNGSTTLSNVPVSLSMRDVVDVTAGGAHSCLVTSTSGVQCWGSAVTVGDGTNLQRNSPVTLPNITGVTAIDAGGQHTCARLGNGTMKCWGYNSMGQLGIDSTTAQNSPIAVTGLTGAEGLGTGGYVSCSLHELGKVARCWGQNNHGQVGDGTTTNRRLPVLVVP